MNELRKCRCGNIINTKNDYVCSFCNMKNNIEKQERKFDGLIEGKDFVRCKCTFENGSICNWPDSRLTGHLKSVHGYDKHKYYELHPTAEIVSNNTKQRFAATGVRSEQARENMSKSHKGIEPWNKGKTKENNDSLRAASEKMKELTANK